MSINKTVRIKACVLLSTVLCTLSAGVNVLVAARADMPTSTSVCSQASVGLIQSSAIMETESIRSKLTSDVNDVASAQQQAIKNMRASNIVIGNNSSNDIADQDNSIEMTNSSGHTVGAFCSLPNLPTNVKACTDYRCYGIRSTPHWRLQQVAWTDEWGLRRFNDDYIVGLGTYYSTDIGDRFEVTLDTGRVFTIILGDNKADCDTDVTNRYKPCAYYTSNDANVLEFIADFQVMPDWVYARGTIDCIDDFAGNIVSLKYIGRDTSGDWDSYI